MGKKTTQQDSVTPPELRNPTGKGGFGDHPENRNPGGWKPDVTFSYQYKRYMAMSLEEFAIELTKLDSKRTVVQELAIKAVQRAKSSLPDLKEMTDRTEGKAPQSIDLKNNGGSFEPVVVKIIDATNRNTT